jgi:hypothetical protein
MVFLKYVIGFYIIIWFLVLFSILIAHFHSFPSSTDISLGYSGDGLADELDVQCYVHWTSSDNPNVATYDIKMRYP